MYLCVFLIINGSKISFQSYLIYKKRLPVCPQQRSHLVTQNPSRRLVLILSNFLTLHHLITAIVYFLILWLVFPTWCQNLNRPQTSDVSLHILVNISLLCRFLHIFFLVLLILFFLSFQVHVVLTTGVCDQNHATKRQHDYDITVKFEFTSHFG